MTDARFEDAPLTDRPLRLVARDEDDLAVVSALVQDSVGRVGDIRWMARRHRLVVLINRFRWEDAPTADAASRPYERVRAALSVEGALGLRARGIDPGRKDAVLSLLALAWEPGEEAAGTLFLAFAGGAEMRVRAEMLEVSLADLTQPWTAQAAEAPSHDD